MSRAFVKDDAEGPDPRVRYPLPPRDDPAFDEAAARALLQGANQGDSFGAEEATGYAWGDARLVPIMTRLRDEAIERGDDRMETLAERYLRAAGHR